MAKWMQSAAGETESQASAGAAFPDRSGEYFAFLAKVHQDDNGGYDCLFELVPMDIFNACVFNSMHPSIPDNMPTFLYSLENVHVSEIVDWLAHALPPHVTDPDPYIAEGSWYIMQVSSSHRHRAPSGEVISFADYVSNPTNPTVVSPYYLYQARLWYLPIINSEGECDYQPVNMVGSTSQNELWLNNLRTSVGLAVDNQEDEGDETPPYLPNAVPQPSKDKLKHYDVELGATPTQYTITSVGIMDVGTANCNMLINNDAPMLYFDTGYPLPFASKTPPPNLLKGNTAPTSTKPASPITSNGGGSTFPEMVVILSHYDGDHWLLAKMVPALQNLTWLLPSIVHKSAEAVKFEKALLKNKKNAYAFPSKLPAGTTVKQIAHITNVEIHKCIPPHGSSTSSSFVANNTGIAMVVKDITFSNDSGHIALMSDTNFTSVPALSPGSTSPIYKNILGITAVHHGSKNHHASESFPSPQKKTSTGTIMPATGRIAYSYGMYNSGLSSGAPGSSFTWKHPYRFPAPTAITNYQNGSWPGTGAKITTTTQQSTAEGMNLNNTPAPAIATALPPNRGNIRIGDQTALGTSFNTSAFFKIKHSLT